MPLHPSSPQVFPVQFAWQLVATLVVVEEVPPVVELPPVEEVPPIAETPPVALTPPALCVPPELDDLPPELALDFPPVAVTPPVLEVLPAVAMPAAPLAAIEPPLELVLGGLPLQPQSRESNNSDVQMVNRFVIVRPSANAILPSAL